MRQFLLALTLVLVSCTPAPLPPKVSADDARKNVAAYIGHHAWGISLDTARNVVRDRVLYYAVALDGASDGDPQGFYVNGDTGDLYDLKFHLERLATELVMPNPEPQEPAQAVPEAFVGSFSIGHDPTLGQLTVADHEFSLGDDGQVLSGTLGSVEVTGSKVQFTVTGSLHDGQDENSKTYDGPWTITLVATDEGVVLEAVSGPGGLAIYEGKTFWRDQT